jgi:ATP-dependent Clp protease protease subunit
MNTILAKHTGQTSQRIKEDTERDRYLSAEQAQEYGLIDDVIEPKRDK